MEDREIIELYFRRDEQAIGETEKKYGRLCRRVAENILGNREDSEECVNDTYAGVWNAIPPAKPFNFTAFLCRIARNQALKRLEFQTREKRSPETVLSLEELAEVLPDERYAPGTSDEEVGRLISQFLLLQEAPVRAVFLRKYFFFDSVREIAKRYSFTESKVKSMLFQTRNRLKDYLSKEGVAL